METERTPKIHNLVIIGYGYTKKLYNYEKGDEVWTYLNGYEYTSNNNIPLSRLIITHKQVTNFLTGTSVFNWSAISRLKCTVTTLHDNPDLPNSTRYPLKEIVAKYGTSYFASTHAYCLALALYLNYRRIFLYGWDMTEIHENIYDRFGIEYWVGLGQGMGVEIWWPPSSAICQTITKYPYAMIETQA
jgi:hypothetical protein